MLLMSNVSQTPLHVPPVVAVLPSFLSTSTHTPRQHPPAPQTAPAHDTPAATPAPAPTPADASPTRAFTSDEAWLRAQTDSRRLDAMWMAAELNTIPDLMRDQEDHLSAASPSVLMSMPPSGLIRSICFVGEHMTFALSADQLKQALAMSSILHHLPWSAWLGAGQQHAAQLLACALSAKECTHTVGCLSSRAAKQRQQHHSIVTPGCKDALSMSVITTGHQIQSNSATRWVDFVCT